VQRLATTLASTLSMRQAICETLHQPPSLIPAYAIGRGSLPPASPLSIAHGLFYGNAKLFAIQALAVAVVLVYSFVVTYGLLKLLDKIMGLRVSREDEMMGLDLSEHGEAGYSW